MKYRVVLVDDHAILTEGLKRLLESNSDFEVVASFTTASFAWSYIQADAAVDLVVVDYSMPDMSGVEFIQKLKSKSKAPKVLMLSMHDEPAIVKEAISSGADGYVLKKAVAEELANAMRRIMEGRPYWSAEVGQALFQQAKQVESHADCLTDRELEILQLIVKELTSKEIAKQLFISERTVEVHRKNLMRKANCHSTVGLIKFAYAKGLI